MFLLDKSLSIAHSQILDGIKVIERFFTVPLDYAKPDGETIRVFVRNMIPLHKAGENSEKEVDLPYSMLNLCLVAVCCELWFCFSDSLVSSRYVHNFLRKCCRDPKLTWYKADRGLRLVWALLGDLRLRYS